MEILKYRQINKGNLIAFFTVKLPSGMEIRDCKLMDGQNGEWIGFPSSTFTDKEGKTRYTNIVHIGDRDRSNVFQAACMKALEPHRNGNPPKQEQEEGEPPPF